MTKYSTQYQNLGMEEQPSQDLVERSEQIFLAACKKMDIMAAVLPDYAGVPEKYRRSSLAHMKLMIIRDAIVNNKEADYDNDERKYEGWYWLDKPGFRFSDARCDVAYAGTGGGPRLCTFSREDQEFFSNECIALWADFMGAKLPAR